MRKMFAVLACLSLLTILAGSIALAQDATPEPAVAEPGTQLRMLLLPKFLGILPFDQTNQGAQEAAAELGVDPENYVYDGPTAENSVAGQIEIVTNAVTQGFDAVMISNNSGDQIVPSAQAARDAGLTVVTWDSPIPSGQAEQLFVAQVDFGTMGATLAMMAKDIVGDDGGQIAILSASPDAANQNSWIAAMEEELAKPEYANIELVETVYGNDQSEESYNQALGLIDKYPDLELIVAPTSVGAPAAAKALQDEGICGEGTENSVVVSGLAAPEEMESFIRNGCAPAIAWWSFVDLGYLTYYTTYLIATGALDPVEGASYEAGRLGVYTIEKDPTRENGNRVVLGPFTIIAPDTLDAYLSGGAEEPMATEEASS